MSGAPLAIQTTSSAGQKKGWGGRWVVLGIFVLILCGFERHGREAGKGREKKKTPLEFLFTPSSRPISNCAGKIGKNSRDDTVTLLRTDHGR